MPFFLPIVPPSSFPNPAHLARCSWSPTSSGLGKTSLMTLAEMQLSPYCFPRALGWHTLSIGATPALSSPSHCQQCEGSNLAIPSPRGSGLREDTGKALSTKGGWETQRKMFKQVHVPHKSPRVTVRGAHNQNRSSSHASHLALQ